MPIYKQNIDEARRVSGKEYIDYKSSIISGKIKDTSDLYGKADSADKVGTTSLGTSILDSVTQNQIEKIDLEKEKVIYESSNFIEEYNDYVEGHFDKVIGRDAPNEKGQLENRMAEQYKYLVDITNGDERLAKGAVLSNFYGITDIMTKLSKEHPEYSQDELNNAMTDIMKTSLRLRINYVNKITNLLAQMLKVNYRVLGLTEEECKIYIDRLKSGKNDSVKAAGELKEIIRNNSDKFSINGGEGFDFRPLGYGCIFGTSERLNFKGTTDNQDAMLDMLQKVMRYDAVVVAHGGNNEKIVNNNTEKLNNISDNIHDYLKDRAKDIDINSLGSPYKEYIKTLKDNGLDIDDFLRVSAVNRREMDNFILNKFKRTIDYIFIDDVISKKSEEEASKMIISAVESIDIKEFISMWELKYHTDDELDKDTIKKLQDVCYKLITTSKEIQDFIKYNNRYAYKYVFEYTMGIINRVNKNEYNKREKYWSCQPTRTLNGGPFTDVNELVRQLIKEGFKKICIEDCNPGHHELADDIMKTKGVVFNYSKVSNYVESAEIDFDNNPEYSYVNEMEESLKSLAKSLSVDYNDDVYLVECCNWYLDGIKHGFEPIDEGAIDTLKEFLKKIVAGIVGLIKRIVNFVKQGIQRFIQMFRGTKESPKDTKTEAPVEIKAKLLDVKSRSVIEIKGKNREDFEATAKKICEDISNQIKTINNEQQKGLNQAQKLIDDMEKHPEQIMPKTITQKDDTSTKEESAILNILNNSYLAGAGLLSEGYRNQLLMPLKNKKYVKSTILEFDANGDEKNIPGVADNDSEDYSFDDISSDTDQNNTATQTADRQDQNTNTQVTQQDDTSQPQQDQQEDDSEEYNMDNNTSDDDQDETQQNGDYPQQDDSDNNEDEYSLNDTDDDQSNGEDSDEYNMGDDNAQSGFKKIEDELFEKLTPKQKEIKIKALKQNFLDLYNKCGDISDLISDNTPGSEEESKVFDFVAKTVSELQENIHDYLADTFGTKTYIDNDAQFKQYLVILDSVKKILDEFLNIKVDKKEETGKK